MKAEGPDVSVLVVSTKENTAKPLLAICSPCNHGNVDPCQFHSLSAPLLSMIAFLCLRFLYNAEFCTFYTHLRRKDV